MNNNLVKENSIADLPAINVKQDRPQSLRQKLLNMFNVLFQKDQNRVYDSAGKTAFFENDNLDIVFRDSSIALPRVLEAAIAPTLMALLPSAIDIVFQLTGKALEDHEKKFVAEYTKVKSNLNAGNGFVPNFSLVRSLTVGKDTGNVLIIDFDAKEVEHLKGFVYQISRFYLCFSSAKISSSYASLDYTIEVKVTYWIEGEKKVQELAPISLTSIKFGDNKYKDNRHISDIIPLTVGAFVSEVAIKVVESNPVKIKAGKILSLWNDNKDSVKTIINNILPKANE